MRVSKIALIAAFAASFPVAAQISPAWAGWREQVSEYDLHRIERLEQSRDAGIAQASQGGGTGDPRAVNETLSGNGHTISAGALMGNWRCRQMKLGGIAPYIVYNWFNCRISNVHGGLYFEKYSGSQRMAGFLYPESGAWVYLGASSAPGEPIHRYSGNEASVGAAGTPDDQIGLLSAIGDRRLRLELSAPVQESAFEAVELER